MSRRLAAALAALAMLAPAAAWTAACHPTRRIRPTLHRMPPATAVISEEEALDKARARTEPLSPLGFAEAWRADPHDDGDERDDAHAEGAAVVGDAADTEDVYPSAAAMSPVATAFPDARHHRCRGRLPALPPPLLQQHFGHLPRPGAAAEDRRAIAHIMDPGREWGRATRRR